MKKCIECTTYRIEFTPENIKHIRLQQGKYKSRKKPSGGSIDKTVNEMIRELLTLIKSEPIVVINGNDDFVVMREVSDNERSHIFNAVNKRTKKN